MSKAMIQQASNAVTTTINWEALAAVERDLPKMSDEDVRQSYNACDAGSAEADLFAGEMKRRNLDD